MGNQLHLILLIFFLQTLSALKCYQCGLETDGYCPEDNWDEVTCETSAKLNSDEALACYKITFEDNRAEKVRERRGCTVTTESKLGNCSQTSIAFYDATIQGSTCYCQTKSFCNTSSMLTSLSLHMSFVLSVFHVFI